MPVHEAFYECKRLTGGLEGDGLQHAGEAVAELEAHVLAMVQQSLRQDNARPAPEITSTSREHEH